MWRKGGLLVLLGFLAGAQVAQGGTFASNQPFASFWHPNDLLTWDPATDPDAPYNRSGVPLQSRFLYQGTQVNDHARSGEAEVVALSIMYPSTSNNPSQGSRDFDVFAFNYWQYVTILNFWGGSAGEGLILAPNPGVIDAGHRNGVRIFGTIFFPPNVFGGQLQWVQDLVQMQGATYPVADKLIEVAEYYGFEGWFINQETSGGDMALATALRDFIRYVHDNSSIEIMWYDSMIESGPIAWQNQMNSLNDAFFHESGSRVGDQFFLNFFWNATGLINSGNLAQSFGRSQYELFAGVDVQANGYNTFVNWGALFPEGQPHRMSLGFFAPNWTFSNAAGNDDFYTRANRFWVGANRDPSNTTTPSPWKGAAHYVPAWSAIDSVPFVTHFNTGQGHFFNVDGEMLANFDWNNRGLQELLPTWRWILRSTAPLPESGGASPVAGALLTPALDWTESYYGGTSLELSGALNEAQQLDLFKTKLPLTATSTAQIAFKTGSTGPSHLELALAFEDAGGLTDFEYVDVGAAASTGWNLVNLDLSAHAGKTVAVLGLHLDAGTPVPSYTVHVGRLAVLDGPVGPVLPPTGAFIEDRVEPTPMTTAIRLRWTESPSDVVWYNVYRRNPDNSLTHLGGTANTAYYIPLVTRIGDEETVTIEVEAVGLNYTHSSRSTTDFTWVAATEIFADGFETGGTGNWSLVVE